MAEGLTRHFHGDQIEVRSAGIQAHGLNQNAVQAMAEIDIDISKQSSNRVDTAMLAESDLIITVCGHAQETCPLPPAEKRVIHQGFDDPPALVEEAVKAGMTDFDAMAPYRRVRDQIRTFIERELPELLS